MRQQVQISNLPKEIQYQIPLSIRSIKDIYYLDELPPKERQIIKKYLETKIDISYKDPIYDIIPRISMYSDFYTLKTIKDTISNYLTNYFQTNPGSYPFDPAFGCKLKYQLHTKDTQLRKIIISDQINEIVNIMTSDLNIPIVVKTIEINNIPTSLETQYHCKITISIPGEENIVLTIQDTQL